MTVNVHYLGDPAPMKQVANLLISPSTSLRHTIVAIDRGARQAALVVDDQGHLVGLVTDGDIRRGILAGATLDTPIDLIMNREFRSLPEGSSEHEALAVMRRYSLHQIPALDADGRVVRLFVLDELLEPQALSNWVVLMAGGQGKRLRPLTAATPKPMLQVAGRPMLEIILERFVDAGFQKVFISVNYYKEHILAHFGDGSAWRADVRYLQEDEPSGTAGSLRLLPERPSDPMIIMNGDVLSRVDLGGLLRFHEEHQMSATVCIGTHETQIPFGVVHTEGTQVISLEEKPVVTRNINAGIYVVNPEMLDLLPADEPCDMPQLLELGLKAGLGIAAFPVHEYWLDVGDAGKLDRANGEWS